MAMFGETGVSLSKPVSNQEKIKYLKQYTQLEAEIRGLENDLYKQELKLGRITSRLSTAPKGGGSIHKNPDYDTVDIIADMVKALNLKINSSIAIRLNIEELINNVENYTQRLLLRYRYINGFSFERIAVELNYSWRHTHRLHSKALDNINL